MLGVRLSIVRVDVFLSVWGGRACGCGSKISQRKSSHHLCVCVSVSVSIFISFSVSLSHARAHTHFEDVLAKSSHHPQEGSVGILASNEHSRTKRPDRPVHGVCMHKSRETFSHYFARNGASIKFFVRCSLIPRPADSSVSHRTKCNDPSQMRPRCAGIKLELEATFP